VILGLTDEKNQLIAAERVIKEGLNVRQTEGLIAKLQTRGSRVAAAKPETVARRAATTYRERGVKAARSVRTKVQLHYARAKARWRSLYSDAELNGFYKFSA